MKLVRVGAVAIVVAVAAGFMSGCASKSFEDAIQGTWTCLGSFNGEQRQVTLKFDGTTFEKTMPQVDGDATAEGPFQVAGESSDGTGGTVAYQGEWQSTGFDYAARETFSLDGDTLEGDCTYTRGSGGGQAEESSAETIPSESETIPSESEAVGSGDTSDGGFSGGGAFIDLVQGDWKANPDEDDLLDISFSGSVFDRGVVGSTTSFEVVAESVSGGEVRAEIGACNSDGCDTTIFYANEECLWLNNAAYNEKSKYNFWFRPGGDPSSCQTGE